MAPLPLNFKSHRLTRVVAVAFVFGSWTFAQSIGWQNAGTDGQARALSNNTASVLGNPAAITQPRRLEGEVGVANIGENPLQAFSSWVFPVGVQATVGAALIEPDLGALDNHRLVVSGSTRPFLGTWLGARGVVQKTPEDLRLDLALGGMHHLNGHWALAWTADHLTEGLDSAWCGDCGKRDFGVGAAWLIDLNGRYSLWSDATFQQLSWSEGDPSLSAGMRIEVGRDRNLQIIGGARWYKSDNGVQASAGLAFQQPFYSTLVSMRYAMSHLGVSVREGAPVHQISLAVVWDASRDRKDPRPFVNSKWATISPDGKDDLPRETLFLNRVEEESGKLAKWSLVVYTSRPDMSPGQMVRRFKGAGLPPRSIRWAGDDVMGQPVSAGVYAFRLIAEDEAGNQAWTNWQYLEIR